jgi:hypothetical protein
MKNIINEINKRSFLINELLKAESLKKDIKDKLDNLEMLSREHQEIEYQLNYVNGLIAGLTIALANQ